MKTNSKAFSKKFLCVLLAVSLLLCLAACGKENATGTAEADPNRITISTGNGSNRTYMLELQKAAKEKFGIDLEFVYQYSSDTSNSLAQEFRNDDLCADILVTASAVSNEYLKNTCLDYLTNSHITDYFTYAKVKEYTADNGGLYQLPFTSKLIGVTYNKTLLEEMGWQVPENYSDMLNLKERCDEAGILFAVTGGCAAGHGFNWLFHLMGADWISTLEGDEWFTSFLKGETTVDAFAEEARYFEKYYESGLFGTFYTADWSSSEYYREHRALFHYDLTNGLSRCLRLNEDGTIYGAEYDGNGEVKAVESDTGAYVRVSGVWTVYEENNILHSGLQRYGIPGASIDEFAAMPWISESGTNNRFTCYDNMFVMLNKSLGGKGQEAKLANVLKLLEYMCTEEATKSFSDTNPDGYVAVNNFRIDENRSYYRYAEKVQSGYIQPWYYILVDTATLMDTGYAVNDYMAGGDTAYEDVIRVFSQGVADNVNHVENILVTATETFSYEQLARLLAYVGGTDLQNKLTENGIDKEVSASLMPYTVNRGDMVNWGVDYLGMVSTKLYKGKLEEALIRTIFSSKANSAQAIEMTGAELNQIVKKGLDRSEGGKNYDSSAFGPYPYAVLVKGGGAIDESKTYVVAVNEMSLSKEDYETFRSNGKILTDSEGKIISGSLEPALNAYFREVKTVTPGKIEWK